MHRSRAPNCPFVRQTVTRGAVPELATDGRKDMVDFNPDVEDDGPSEDHLGLCSLPKKDVGMTTKPLQPVTIISKLPHL